MAVFGSKSLYEKTSRYASPLSSQKRPVTADVSIN